MRVRGAVIVVMLLAVVLAALVPLAYASPPGATWFAGFWDDDDYDDVVLAAVQTVASAEASPAHCRCFCRDPLPAPRATAVLVPRSI